MHERKTWSDLPSLKLISSSIFPLESVKTGKLELTLEKVLSTKTSVKFKKAIVVVSVVVEVVVDDVVIERVKIFFIEFSLK